MVFKFKYLHYLLFHMMDYVHYKATREKGCNGYLNGFQVQVFFRGGYILGISSMQFMLKPYTNKKIDRFNKRYN